MGMYSSFITEEIKVLDENKFNELITQDEDLKGFTSDYLFGNWDSWKLEGYWYDETVQTLDNLASVLEGYAEFIYEEGYKFRIVFEKGKWYYQREVIDWNNIKKEEISKDLI